jgi:tetratricopeptide (TPR) repeat protein
MFEQLGRNQDALTSYLRAISLAPKRYLYYQGAGDCYRRLKQARQAKKAYLTGRELAADALVDNPSDGFAHALLGYFFAQLADERNAEREIAQAVQLASDDLEIIRTSALAEEAMHHRDKVLALVRGTPVEFLQSLGREPDLAEFRLDLRFQTMVAQHAAN